MTDDNERFQQQAQYLQKVMDGIIKHGVMIQAVGASEDSPTFSYTVGLAAMEEPELIIFGLDPETSARILNAMVIDSGEGDDVRAYSRVTGKGWIAGPSDNVFGNDVSAYLITVTPQNSLTYLTVSNALFADPVTALQVVYPDKQGRWPWEKDSAVAGQPLLGSKP